MAELRALMESDLGFSAAGAAGAGAVGAGAVGTMVLRVLVVVADLIREPAPSRGRHSSGQGVAQGAAVGGAAAAAPGGDAGQGTSQGLGQGGAGPSREAGARAASAGPSEAPSVRSPPDTVKFEIFQSVLLVAQPSVVISKELHGMPLQHPVLSAAGPLVDLASLH